MKQRACLGTAEAVPFQNVASLALCACVAELLVLRCAYPVATSSRRGPKRAPLRMAFSVVSDCGTAEAVPFQKRSESNVSAASQRPAPSVPAAVCNSDRIGRILKSDYSGRSFRLLLFRRIVGARRVSVLSELKIGEAGVVVALDLPESVQNHLMHMGFVPDALVTALRRAPAGDPTVYGVDGMEIALRHETAGSIRVRLAREGRLTANAASTLIEAQR
jgi:ferrous iron transport protein A